jgi:hypothetical protein
MWLGHTEDSEWLVLFRILPSVESLGAAEVILSLAQPRPDTSVAEMTSDYSIVEFRLSC